MYTPSLKTPALVVSALLMLGTPALAQTTASSASASPAPAPMGPNGQKMTPAERFAKMDTNKDGVITRDEFTGRRPEMFDLIDANKDGKLTKEEISAAMKARMGRRGE